jgi:hypothetical protein
MGLSSLKSSVRSAKIIYDNIKKRNIEELDGWVQEKMTLAADYLKNVADYMEDLDEYEQDGTNTNSNHIMELIGCILNWGRWTNPLFNH